MKLVSSLVFPDGSYSETAPQTSLWKKVTYTWLSTNATNGQWTGTIGAGNGTYTNALPNTAGSIYAGMKRSRYANVVTTTNQLLGQRGTESLFFVGDVAGKGGFFFQTRFGFDAWAAGGRFFAGLSGTTNNVVTANNPSANGSSTVGFSVDDNEVGGVIQFMSRRTATTKQSTGMVLTINTAYDCRFFCPPNGTYISWFIKNLETGEEASGVITTDLPNPTGIMTVGVLASNAALTTVTAIQLGVTRIYLETDT